VIKRELHRRLIYECRCDERLKGKSEGSNTPRIHWVVWKDKVVYCEAIKRELHRRLMSVGVMKDQKLRLRDLHASDTLGSGGGLEHLKKRRG
jgi:hypothetical protein